MSAAIHIGSSGWSYPHWRGPVYPRSLAQKEWLACYSKDFSTVEINRTFYSLPAVETFEVWTQTVPTDFIFAVKASRFITHMKKLKDPAEGLERLLDVTAHLGDKRGPLLFQLPPRWRVNVERLDGFLAELPRGCRAAFEFRDPSWLVTGVFEALHRHGAALCIYDIDGQSPTVELTADFTYVRLHGPGPRYRGSYPRRALDDWARQLSRWAAEGIECFCYFDNDAAGHAFHDALTLKALL